MARVYVLTVEQRCQEPGIHRRIIISVSNKVDGTWKEVVVAKFVFYGSGENHLEPQSS